MVFLKRGGKKWGWMMHLPSLPWSFSSLFFFFKQPRVREGLREGFWLESCEWGGGYGQVWKGYLRGGKVEWVVVQIFPLVRQGDMVLNPRRDKEIWLNFYDDHGVSWWWWWCIMMMVMHHDDGGWLGGYDASLAMFHACIFSCICMHVCVQE